MPEKNTPKTGGNSSQPAGSATRWTKGTSGNPKGRPRGVQNHATRDIREIAQALTLGDPQFVATVQRQLRSGTCHPSLVQTLLAYGYGRPVERVGPGGEVGLRVPSLVQLLERIDAERAKPVGASSTGALPDHLQDDPRQYWLARRAAEANGHPTAAGLAHISDLKAERTSP